MAVTKFNYIWVTSSFIGFHRYPDAPDEVAYLREVHRHKFNVKVYLEIFHNDREVEFHMFKTYIDNLLIKKDLNYRSCEMIAENLYFEINNTYPNRDIIIDVDEDGENGCHIEFIREAK